MNIGSTIKSIRKQQSVQQNTLAKLSEITQTYLSQIENNIKEPNLSTLKKIAKNLGVPLPILFFLALDENDIILEKRNAYDQLAPTIKNIIMEFFNSNNLNEKNKH